MGLDRPGHVIWGFFHLVTPGLGAMNSHTDPLDYALRVAENDAAVAASTSVASWGVANGSDTRSTVTIPAANGCSAVRCAVVGSCGDDSADEGSGGSNRAVATGAGSLAAANADLAVGSYRAASTATTTTDVSATATTATVAHGASVAAGVAAVAALSGAASHSRRCHG